MQCQFASQSDSVACLRRRRYAHAGKHIYPHRYPPLVERLGRARIRDNIQFFEKRRLSFLFDLVSQCVARNSTNCFMCGICQAIERSPVRGVSNILAMFFVSTSSPPRYHHGKHCRSYNASWKEPCVASTSILYKFALCYHSSRLLLSPVSTTLSTLLFSSILLAIAAGSANFQFLLLPTSYTHIQRTTIPKKSKSTLKMRLTFAFLSLSALALAAPRPQMTIALSLAASAALLPLL
jgi:hypothetical protein